MVSDNAPDIRHALQDLGKYEWVGCAGHNLNLIIKEGFKKCFTAALLLKKCKSIVKTANKSSPLLYDIRKFQEEIDLPGHTLLQEVTTRWWSILAMMDSIVENHIAIALALAKQNQLRTLMLDSDELEHVKQIVELLQAFKTVGEQLSSETHVTISMIIPTYDFLLKTSLTRNLKTANCLKP